MDSQNFLLGGESRFHPDPGGALVQEVGLGVDQSSRALRMVILAEPGCGLVENQSKHNSRVPPILTATKAVRRTILDILSAPYGGGRGAATCGDVTIICETVH